MSYKHLRVFALMFVMAFTFSLMSMPVAAYDDLLIEVDTELSASSGIWQRSAENARTLLASIYGESEAYGISKEDYVDIALGSQIQTFDLVDGELEPTEVAVFPLYSGDSLIAFITSFYVENTLESMISTDYVDEITSSLDEDDAYALVYDCNGVQLVSSYGIDTIQEYAYDDNLSDLDDCNIQEISASIDMTTVNIVSEVIEIEGVDATIQGTARGSGNVNLSVPKYNQGSTKLCWAYTVASIGNFLSSNVQYTGIEVAKELHGDDYNHGADTNDALDVLDYLYGYYYDYKTSTLTESKLFDILDAGYPVYAYYTSSLGGAHAVVLRAINTSSHYFSIMNPGNGLYQGFTNTSGNYTITYNSKSWDLDEWGYYYYYD